MIEAQPIESFIDPVADTTDQTSFRQRLSRNITWGMGHATEMIGKILDDHPSLVIFGSSAIMIGVSSVFVVSEDKTVVTQTLTGTPFSVWVKPTITDRQYEALFNISASTPTPTSRPPTPIPPTPMLGPKATVGP